MQEKINKIKEETSKLSAATRDRIRNMNAWTVEIKSTRLAQKYKDRAGFTTYQDRTQIARLADSLKGLDFLTYPFFIRQGNFTFFEYCLYVNKYFLHTDLKGASLAEYVKNIELGNACDIYMRVFVDEVEKKALIMGFIDRFSFFRYPATHKLVLPGKSENALYFVKKLRDARPLTDLEHVLKN